MLFRRTGLSRTGLSKTGLSRRGLCAFGAVLLCSAQGGQALTIQLFDAGGVSSNPDVAAAYREAADRWEALLTDPVNLKLNISYAHSANNALAWAQSSFVTASYTDVRGALQSDISSADDAIAAASLVSGSGVNLILNRTSDSPNGSASETPYFDNNGSANNQSLYLSRANARAIGLLPANDVFIDASVTFNSKYNWDYNPDDGVPTGQYDFVGVAMHEIAHALGFLSGVDVLDQNSPPYTPAYAEDDFTFITALDLYRSSPLAASFGAGTIDWTAGPREKFFSIDGGSTFLAEFATGVNFGDGSQASHWQNANNHGLMDPQAAAGVALSVSGLDIAALDVIGWDVAAVPASAPLGAALMGLLGLGLQLRRQKSTR